MTAQGSGDRVDIGQITWRRLFQNNLDLLDIELTGTVVHSADHESKLLTIRRDLK